MKIIHCADIHLDSKLTTNLSKEEAIARNTEILNTFLKMIEYAHRYEVKIVLIAGDLFDSDNVSERTRGAILEKVHRYPEIQFYYLRGNHDTQNSFLQGNDKPLNLNLFEETLKVYKVMLANGRYINIGGVELDNQNSRDFAYYIDFDPMDFNILMLHGQIREQNIVSGGEISLPALYNKHIDYLALGHIHQYRRGNVNPRGIYCYPGCLEGRGFDEKGEHGFVMLEVDEETFRFKVGFVAFAKRRIIDIEVDITGLNNIAQIMQAILQEIEERNCKNTDALNITLVGTIDFSDDVGLSYIRQVLEEEFYKVRVHDRRKPKVEYEEYQYSTSLKGEFIRIVNEEKELDEEKKEKIIKCGIDFLMGV